MTSDNGGRLLGLDLGTSRIKAVVMDGEGRVRNSAAIATPFHGTEMPVDELVAALGQLCLALGEDRQKVVAVGIAGIAESGAPLDRDGRPLAPVIVWHDPRGAEVVDRLLLAVPDLELRIGQRLRTVSSVAKLGWLVDHGVGPVARWLGVPELALHALTTRPVTDFSLAARTGAFDVGSRRYLPEVLEALRLGSEVFPVVEPAGSVMARIHGPGASWSGLPQGIPVTIAGHDHLAGRSGSGARCGDFANSVGTAETVIAGAPTLPPVDRALAHRVAVTVAPGGEGWALLASAARSGLVLSALARALGRSPDELDREAEGAEAAPIGNGLIEAAVRGEAMDLPHESPGAVWNGFLTALASRTWEAVDRLEEVTVGGADRAEPVVGGGIAFAAQDVVGTEPSRGLVVFGGGSRSHPWLKAKAAARPSTPVWRSSAPEAVACGAAVFAGMAAGWWTGPDSAPGPGPERIVTG